MANAPASSPAPTPLPGPRPDAPPPLLSRQDIPALLAVVALALVVRCAWFVGLLVDDDLDYFRQAHLLSRGQWTPQPDWVFSLRLAFLGPMAAAFAAFGAGEGSAMLYGIACSAGEVVLGFLLARRFGRSSAVVAGGVLALYPLSAFYASTGRPDAALSFWMGLSVFLFLRAHDGGTPPRRRTLFFAGVALGVAFWVVERAILLLPFLGLYALIVRRGVRPYLAAGAGFVAVLAVEWALFGALAGDPFLRIAFGASTESQFYRDTVSVNLGIWGDSLWPRLAYELPSFLFNPLDKAFAWSGVLGWGVVLAVLANAAARSGRDTWPFLLWWGMFLASWNFWPFRVHPYIPAFFFDPRYLLPHALPAAVLVAHAVTVAGARRPRLAVAGLAGMAAVHLVGLTVCAREPATWIEPIRRARDFLAGRPGERVATDPRTLRRLEFLEGYRHGRALTDFREDPHAFRSGLVVVNDAWVDELESHYRLAMPDEIHHPPARWKEVFRADIPAAKSLRAALLGAPQPSAAPRSLRIYEIPAEGGNEPGLR